MKWSVETLNDVVDSELEELPADMLARFHYISQLIEEFGLERVREPPLASVSSSSGCLSRKRGRRPAGRSSWR